MHEFSSDMPISIRKPARTGALLHLVEVIVCCGWMVVHCAAWCRMVVVGGQVGYLVVMVAGGGYQCLWIVAEGGEGGRKWARVVDCV